METLAPSIVVLISGAIIYYILYSMIECHKKQKPDDGLRGTVYQALARGLITTDEAISQLKSLGVTQRETYKAVCLALKEYDEFMRKKKEEEGF